MFFLFYIYDKDPFYQIKLKVFVFLEGHFILRRFSRWFYLFYLIKTDSVFIKYFLHLKNMTRHFLKCYVISVPSHKMYYLRCVGFRTWYTFPNDVCTVITTHLNRVWSYGTSYWTLLQPLDSECKVLTIYNKRSFVDSVLRDNISIT